MGAEHPLRDERRMDRPDAPGTPSRSPLAVKKAKTRCNSEASLCAIKITREAARAANQRQEPRHETDRPVGMGFRGDDIGASVVNISSTGAMIRCRIEPVIGETLELTFPGEERINGIVRWVRDGCIGIEFGGPGRGSPVPAAAASERTGPPPLRQIKLTNEEPVKPAEPENRLDPAGNRSFRRARVLLAAKLRTNSGELDARLRDLSCKGALLDCPAPLAVGDAVVFVRGDTVVPARIAWTSGERVGLEFDRAIEESEVMVHVNRAPAPPQNHIQALEQANRQAAFRRPSFSDRLSDYDRKLARVIGATLGVSLTDE
jgi:hypothetical protein